MKIDIYNYIIKELKNVLLLKSMNTKYYHNTIFDSLIFILKSNISWNEKIIVNNNIVKTNSIYKHFSFLSKIDFFNTLLTKIIDKFFKNDLMNSSTFLADTTFVFNKKCNVKNIKRNPYKCNKYGFKISVITNEKQIPISILFAGGNRNDLKMLEEQLDAPLLTKYLKNKYFLVDKGYKSKNLKQLFNSYDTLLILPKEKHFYPETNVNIYKKRIKIEHLFAKIKNYKRISHVFEKYIDNFKSFVYIAFLQLIMVGYITN